MRIGYYGGGSRDWGQVKAASREFKYCLNLFAGNAKLLNEFFDVRARFKVFKDRGYGHPRVFEHPGATAAIGYAFYSGALRPV